MMFMPDIVVFLWTISLGVCDISGYAEMFIRVPGGTRLELARHPRRVT